MLIYIKYNMIIKTKQCKLYSTYNIIEGILRFLEFFINDKKSIHDNKDCNDQSLYF